MHSILDAFAPKFASSFVPASPGEVLALRLAHKLDDLPGIRAYASLVEEFSEGQLLSAYRSALRTANSQSYWHAFRAALKSSTLKTHDLPATRLLSLRIAPRAIAIAVFKDSRLEYSDTRNVPASVARATGSAMSFLSWVLEQFECESAAMEVLLLDPEIGRRQIHDVVSEELRRRGTSIWEIPQQELLAGFGHPPLRTRAEMRSAIERMWPLLPGNRSGEAILDAIALGLHVQIERLFLTNF